MPPHTFLAIAISWLVWCTRPVSAFVAWRPDTEPFDPQVAHALTSPPPHVVRRLDSVIRRAEFKFRRSGTWAVDVPAKRQTADDDLKTSGLIGLHSDPADISYWVEAKFGTSDKTFRLVLDTGSADTWIPSSDCSSKSCLAHETHGPLDSETLKFSTNDTFSIRYASGNVDGIIVQDTMTLGAITLKDIKFGLAETVSDDFVSFPIDGILGLGFPAASAQKVPIFLENLISQSIVTKRMFGVYLHRSSDGRKHGSVLFGAVDGARVDGGLDALTYHSLTPNSGLWSIQLEDMILDGEEVGLEGGRKAVVDTGTSLILIPPDDALKLHQFIPRAQSNGETYYIPCDTETRLEFVFGRKTYQVLPKDYIGEPVDPVKGLCLSLIVGRSVLHDGAWLVGDIFLKNVYSVYDMDNLQIGFGKLVEEVDSPDNSMSSTNAIYPTSGATAAASSGVTPQAPSAPGRPITSTTSLAHNSAFPSSASTLAHSSETSKPSEKPSLVPTESQSPEAVDAAPTSNSNKQGSSANFNHISLGFTGSIPIIVTTANLILWC